MLEKISRFLSDYKVKRMKLDNTVKTLKIIQASLGSLLLSLLILLIPGLLIYNLMIIQSIRILLYVLIFILLLVFVYLYEYFFIKIIKNYYEQLSLVNFNSIIYLETGIFTLILWIFTIIVLTII